MNKTSVAAVATAMIQRGFRDELEKLAKNWKAELHPDAFSRLQTGKAVTNLMPLTGGAYGVGKYMSNPEGSQESRFGREYAKSSLGGIAAGLGLGTLGALIGGKIGKGYGSKLLPREASSLSQSLGGVSPANAGKALGQILGFGTGSTVGAGGLAIVNALKSQPKLHKKASSLDDLHPETYKRIHQGKALANIFPLLGMAYGGAKALGSSGSKERRVGREYAKSGLGSLGLQLALGPVGSMGSAGLAISNLMAKQNQPKGMRKRASIELAELIKIAKEWKASLSKEQWQRMQTGKALSNFGGILGMMYGGGKMLANEPGSREHSIGEEYALSGLGGAGGGVFGTAVAGPVGGMMLPVALMAANLTEKQPKK